MKVYFKRNIFWQYPHYNKSDRISKDFSIKPYILNRENTTHPVECCMNGCQHA